MNQQQTEQILNLARDYARTRGAKLSVSAINHAYQLLAVAVRSGITNEQKAEHILNLAFDYAQTRAGGLSDSAINRTYELLAGALRSVNINHDTEAITTTTVTTVGDGKYQFVRQHGILLRVMRNGVDWPVGKVLMEHIGAVHACLDRIEELEKTEAIINAQLMHINGKLGALIEQKR